MKINMGERKHDVQEIGHSASVNCSSMYKGLSEKAAHTYQQKKIYNKHSPIACSCANDLEPIISHGHKLGLEYLITLPLSSIQNSGSTVDWNMA